MCHSDAAYGKLFHSNKSNIPETDYEEESMALRNILTEGDELLRKTSRDVTAFDEKLARLLDDMWETMADASGVGLAAPQVGILRRAVVIDATPPDSEKTDAENHNHIELINPVIMESEGETTGSEGCLSLPGVSGVVRRPAHVKVSAFDRDGNEIEVEGDGLLAKIICHEVDHLDGVLFTDKAYSIEKIAL
jgi:peptide deformylase